MTTEEFSNEFDVLLGEALTLDEYEKSVFLTKAQEEILISLYNGTNPTGVSFDKTEEVRRYLDTLINTDMVHPDSTDKSVHIENNSLVFNLGNKDLWIITYEALRVTGSSNDVPVIPTTQDEYHRIKNNPFRGVSNNRALRIDMGQGKMEILTNNNLSTCTYLVKYLKKPSPIILIPLSDNLTINNENKVTECSLHPMLHRAILHKAVQLALISRAVKEVEQ